MGAETGALTFGVSNSNAPCSVHVLLNIRYGVSLPFGGITLGPLPNTKSSTESLGSEEMKNHDGRL